ncbi:glycosyltransferase [Sulfurovum sp.]|uniref:glycosyltransferase n=1 Tax=Sulfurovum sp. TaxID=1969726 RepID=UPI003563D6EB
MRKKKVLQLGKFYSPYNGGIETVTFDITEYLNAQGIKTDVLCSNEKNEYSDETMNGYNVFRTKSWGVHFSTSITPQLITKLRKKANNYDILHIHLPNPMVNLALLLVNTNQKIVLHWHSDIIKQKYLLKLYEPLQTWLLRRADSIITTSPKYMEESLVLQPYIDKCISIPLGIDEYKMQYTDAKVQSIKEKYKNKKIIFTLGRLIYYKGFEYLIDAGKYLDDSFIILIGGKGELKEELEQKIKKEKLEDRVKLLGRIEDYDLGNYFKACDLFCLPSIAKSEAFGVVQIEAMSFGKPIVATNIKGSGVDWVNKDGVSGLNVPIKDAEAIAEACKTIMSDEKTYQRFSQNARERFQNNFLREKMGDKTIELYKKLFDDNVELENR